MEEDSESTVTSIDEYMENFLNNGTKDVLSDSMLCVFKNIVAKFEERLIYIRRTQAELGVQLTTSSKLFQELEVLFKDIPDFSDQVKLLINAKRKVTNAATLAAVTRARLNNIKKKIEAHEQLEQNSK